MRSERQALADIAKLCDEPTDIGLPRGRVEVGKLRAILADVEPAPAGGTIDRDAPTPEEVARAFHETYERLAPAYGYRTRTESAVPWDDVPDRNQRLMIAVAGQVLALVRSVEGVVLTPEDVDRLHGWYVRLPIGVTVEDIALAQKLEAGL